MTKRADNHVVLVYLEKLRKSDKRESQRNGWIADEEQHFFKMLLKRHYIRKRS